MFPIEIAPGLAHLYLTIALIVLLVCAVVVLVRLRSALDANLSPDRPAHTEDAFVHCLAGRGFNPRIARTTYRYLQQKQTRRLEIEADDRLSEDLGFDHHALRQIARGLLLINERHVSPDFLDAELNTVADLVRLIQTCERRRLDRAA